MESLKWARISWVGDRLTNLNVGEPGNANDFARASLSNFNALDPLRQGEAGDGARHGAPIANDGDLGALADNAVANATNSDAADEVVRGEVGDQHLQWMAWLVHWCGGGNENAIKEWDQVGARLLHVTRGGTGTGIRIDDWEVDLLLVRTEVQEELVDLVDHLLDARIGAVDLVDDEDDGERSCQCLREDVARLWEWPLGGIHQEEDGVYGEEASLHLSAEVGVPRGVDNDHADPLEIDGGLLGEDRDPLLALKVAAIHDALNELCIGPEGAVLAKEAIDQGGLAVVNVRDDTDRADAGLRDETCGWINCGHREILARFADPYTSGHDRCCAHHHFRPSGRPWGRPPRALATG